MSPQWHRLPMADQRAILADNCGSRANIAAATQVVTQTITSGSRAGAWSHNHGELMPGRPAFPVVPPARMIGADVLSTHCWMISSATRQACA